MFELLTALILITQDAEIEATPNPFLLYAIQNVSIKLELLDSRESKYITSSMADFSSDLDLLRRRHKNLVDAPRVSDSHRFPNRNINELIAFNRAYYDYLNIEQQYDPRKYWYYQEIIGETQELYQIWDSVRDARCDYYYIPVRREALKKLKNLIGEENYYRGQLPPCVPIWRFYSLDIPAFSK